MEDGLNIVSMTSFNKGVYPVNGQSNLVMAHKNEEEASSCTTNLEINGSSETNLQTKSYSDSSDCDVLIIDESVKRKSKPNGKRTKKKGPVPIKSTKKIKNVKSSLQQLNQNISVDQNNDNIMQNHLNETLNKTVSNKSAVATRVNNKLRVKRNIKKPGKAHLREYAQYLGLQPSVQFKCVKCKCAGFESLFELNQHSAHCTKTNSVQEPSMIKTSTTQFKIARKVFLCSVCCTYYENWNLFLHMREFHKRYICLYCLGMFSQAEKLSLHLVAKHNCVPCQFDAAEDFFIKYKDPCYLVCCDCEKVFNKQDDFINHKCKDNIDDIVSNKYKEQEKEVNSIVNNKKRRESEAQSTDSIIDYHHLSSIEENKESDLNQDSKVDNNAIMPTFAEPENSVSLDSCETKETVSNNISNTDDSSNVIERESLNPCTGIGTTESLSSYEISIDKENDRNKSENEHNEATEASSSIESFTVSKKRHNSQSFTTEVKETERRVPKFTLKLSKLNSYKVESKDEIEEVMEEVEKKEESLDEKTEDSELAIKTESTEIHTENTNNQLQVAGVDIPIIELELEQPLDKFEIRALIQKCLGATVPTCIYCNHARKIAVNGKQLGLHAIAEHRFSAIVDSITAEELIPESFNSRIKDSLHELENIYFNLESTSPEEAITFSHVFECFQCRYSTTIHKELYLHNRKMHAKTVLLCIMCKSNFYSYSELICHLCPGLYALENDVRFRCCMCVSDELPSAFRLMVHLRKKHHACDVCLELCNNQTKLSNHVWKHKLHHFCYRCGIAYRNKPDITKHLFWKHGTESVLCKKCLQKKWPHVYHFCVPPSSFTCEECNLIFSKAVSLMVHKRIHSDELPHCCTFENCTEKFVSKKLLLKHEFKHREPTENSQVEVKNVHIEDEKVIDETEITSTEKLEVSEKTETELEKLKVDIYDLPELNLSESDSSDSEAENDKEEKEKVKAEKDDDQVSSENVLANNTEDNKNSEDVKNDTEKSVPILENIWDNFKNYQANKEKAEGSSIETDKVEVIPILEDTPLDSGKLLEIINLDHDYTPLVAETQDEKKDVEANMDHDYCFASNNSKKETATTEEIPEKNENKTQLSGSSSDSDTSSCTCGSNCSCSSSSGSSSSSSDSSGSDSSTSEGRRKKLIKKQKKKLEKDKDKTTESLNVNVDTEPALKVETVIQESDLDTTESETDEDFYDENPQKLANQLLAEKRKKLLLLATGAEHINGSLVDTSRPSTPSLPEEYKPKKKSKSKKRKKKKSSKSRLHRTTDILPEAIMTQSELPAIAPLTLSLSKHSPITNNFPKIVEDPLSLTIISSNSNLGNKEVDPNLRSSKRKRVPNKFYGYSSDEDQEKSNSSPANKWRKIEHSHPQPPLTVPPLTIKTVQSPLPAIEPISIRTTPNSGEFKIHRVQPRVKKQIAKSSGPTEESASDSNESTTEEENTPAMPVKQQTALYCYCRCPYDEVSEMIGCDSNDCAIEWFHFECVGIMVPPKGQWFCPDCRKRKQQRKELLQNQ